MVVSQARAIARPVDVASLAQLAQTAARLWLPQDLESPAGAGGAVWRVAVVGVVLGWMLLQLPLLGEAPLKWVTIGGSALVVAAVLWFQARRPPVRRGWELDFDNACLVPAGLAAQEPIHIDPAHHSLGCYVGSGNEHTQTYVLELRHVRRGPVAEISRIPMGSLPLVAGRRELELLDQCVDTLALRLHIRRSGAPIAAPGRFDVFL